MDKNSSTAEAKVQEAKDAKQEAKDAKASAENLKEMERILSHVREPADGDIIEKAKKRMTKSDRMIFDMLPISEAQKEQMLVDMYTPKKPLGNGTGSVSLLPVLDKPTLKRGITLK